MAFAFRGQVLHANCDPWEGLFIEVSGANDGYEGVRLAAVYTDSSGRFSVSCNVVSGYNVGLVTVYSNSAELFSSPAASIDGWENLNLRIVLDGGPIDDPYVGCSNRVLKNFVESAADTVDWKKVDPSRFEEQLFDFVDDWIRYADPDAPGRHGLPATKLPKNPCQEKHSHLKRRSYRKYRLPKNPGQEERSHA
ncbi:MAG: hypothetical protein ABI347_05230 [Nitrososphaera sp.]